MRRRDTRSCTTGTSTRRPHPGRQALNAGSSTGQSLRPPCRWPCSKTSTPLRNPVGLSSCRPRLKITPDQHNGEHREYRHHRYSHQYCIEGHDVSEATLWNNCIVMDRPRLMQIKDQRLRGLIKACPS